MNILCGNSQSNIILKYSFPFLLHLSLFQLWLHPICFSLSLSRSISSLLFPFLCCLEKEEDEEKGLDPSSSYTVGHKSFSFFVTLSVFVSRIRRVGETNEDEE